MQTMYILAHKLIQFLHLGFISKHLQMLIDYIFIITYSRTCLSLLWFQFMQISLRSVTYPYLKVKSEECRAKPI